MTHLALTCFDRSSSAFDISSISFIFLTIISCKKDLIVDVRFIAATNKNLKDEILKNNFREDLFHRLAVIEINVPSLNDRSSDIPLLVEHFLINVL